MANLRRKVLVWSAAGAVVALGGGIGAWAMTSSSASKSSPPGAASSVSSGANSGSGPVGSTGRGSSTTTSSAHGIPPTGTGVAPPASSTPSVPSSTPPPPTTITSAPAGTLVLTQSQAGQSFLIAIGQLVQVMLPGTGQQYHGFTTPQSDDTAVVVPDGNPCSAPSGDFCTEFIGKSSGDARLTSTSDPACRQAVPQCEVASQAWWVNLTFK